AGENHARLPGAASVAVRHDRRDGAHRRADADHGGRRGRALPRGVPAHEARHPERRARHPAVQRAWHQPRGAGALQSARRRLLPPGRSGSLATPRSLRGATLAARPVWAAKTLRVEKKGAVACDLRYCGESAQFGIPAAKLGLAYNVEGHKRLLETVGHARAREIMFLGRRYSAAEALAMGLVHGVYADTKLESSVGKILQTLCENAPLSIANTKTILEEYVKS